MTQCAQQLAAANRVGQVVVAAVFGVEQHQRAAVVQGFDFALVQRSGLIQTVAVARLQFFQTCPRQTAQLLLRAQLHRQHCRVLRYVRRRFAHGRLRDSSQRLIAQVGERVVVIIVFDGADHMARSRLVRGQRAGFVKARVAQIAHFELRLVFFVLELRFRLRLGRRFRRVVGVQLPRQIANFILTFYARRVLVDPAQPDA